MKRDKFFLVRRERDALNELKDGQPAAERMVLEVVAAAAISGLSLSPSFQRVANLLIAAALRNQRLPSKPSGVRSGTARADPLEAALLYRKLVGDGATAEAAAYEVGETLHLSARQVHRYVRQTKDLVDALGEEVDYAAEGPASAFTSPWLNTAISLPALKQMVASALTLAIADAVPYPDSNSDVVPTKTSDRDK